MSKLIKTEDNNTIKVGMFQLQTKSFWLGLVSILVLFLFAVIWLNTYYWYSVCKQSIENNTKIIEKIESTK